MPSGTISVQRDATVDLYNMTNTSVNARAYSIAGVGTSGQGALIKTAGPSVCVSNAVNGLTLTADATLGGSQRFDVANYVNLNNHVLTKIGTNSVAFFTANIQNNSGGIVINDGHIYFEGRNVTLSGPIVVNAKGTLGCYVYAGDAKTFNAPITLTSGGKLWAASNGVGGGKTTFAGTIALSGTTYLYTGYNNSSGQTPGDMIVDSTVSGTGQLILNDSATSTSAASSREIRLNAANTFSGDVRIDRGTLRLGNALALQNATFNTQSGTVGSLSFGTLTTATLGGLKGSNGMALRNDSSSAVALSVGNNNQDTTYSGVLSGAGSLTKIGTGTLVLNNSGPNTYTGGTVVNAGTLLVNNINGSGTGTGDVTVNGGRLGGSGSIGGSVTVGASGTVSAGMSPGHLAISGNYLQSGTLLAELGGSEQGVSYDWLEIRDSSTATFQPGAVIAVNLVEGFTPRLGDTFDILTAAGGITNSDLTGIVFDLSGVPDSARWTTSIVSLGGSAEAIRLTSPVPEPAAFLLLFTGLALLCVRWKSLPK